VPTGGYGPPGGPSIGGPRLARRLPPGADACHLPARGERRLEFGAGVGLPFVAASCTSGALVENGFVAERANVCSAEEEARIREPLEKLGYL
jgi:hypothetical protein